MINISDLKRVQVSFTPQQWDLIRKLEGPMGNTNAEIVRNIVLAWLSEKSMISSSIYGHKGLQQTKKDAIQSTKLQGKVNAKGNFNVEGKTEIEVLNVSGSATFNHDVKAEMIKLNGTADFQGNVNAQQIKGTGTLSIQKTVKAETFTFDGAISINKKLHADTVTLTINKGNIKQIEGNIIKVKSKGGTLHTDTIQGENIELEHTTADLVEGKNINIGKHCEVKEIKAKQLKTHESSSVGTVTKL